MPSAASSTVSPERVGAARFSALAPEVLRALEAGEVATVNLVEFLAIDVGVLAAHVARSIGLDPQADRLQDTLAMLPSFKPMQRHGHVARALYDMVRDRSDRDAVATRLAHHPSDMARSWACYWLQCCDMPLPDKLHAVRRFATDTHFGVREMAWSAVREDVIRDLTLALRLLQAWVADDHPYIRRFACELTRPRGVWCAQIEALKAEPWLAASLLEPLRNDPARYVQNSVANWLNDASKSQPAWVMELVDRWSKASPTAATRYIAQRATRTLRKRGE